MKEQSSTVLDRLNLGKLAGLAILLCGLLGVPYLVHPQEQNEVATVPAETPESTPLAGVTSSTQNPLQIAILHWYNANQTTQFIAGTNPYGVAFDGASIWVCNNGSNNVTKLRASDGLLLGTFAVGTSPLAVAFDGANIWVANIHSNNVTRLRGSTGASLGTFVV